MGVRVAVGCVIACRVKGLCGRWSLFEYGIGVEKGMRKQCV